VTWGGELRWTASEDGASELREEVGLMQSWDYPIRLISPEELAEMEPGLVADPVTTASFGNAEGHIDTTAVISRAFAHATERGVELVTDSR
jgi:glycine/D-amino acid oxidase-like deaminating enzyme